MSFINFVEFIDEKGAKELSLVCNTTEAAIYSWKSRGWVPRDKWPEIQLEYGLTPATLLRMEAGRERSKA